MQRFSGRLNYLAPPSPQLLNEELGCKRWSLCALTISRRAQWVLIVLRWDRRGGRGSEEWRGSFRRAGARSLSADTGRQTVPLPAAPGVAVVLDVASVGKDGTVHHGGVVEALQRELGTRLQEIRQDRVTQDDASIWKMDQRTKKNLIWNK